MKNSNEVYLLVSDLSEIMFDHDYDFDEFLMSYYVIDDILPYYLLNEQK